MKATIHPTCTGPNRACRAAHRAGRSVHIIPGTRGLVLNTYHYATEEQAREALAYAEATAPTIRNDADLESARAYGLSYRLPVGWIDPTMRRPANRGYPSCMCGHALCFLDRQFDECPNCMAEIHPYLRLDNDMRPIDPTIPVGFIPMNNGLVMITR